MVLSPRKEYFYSKWLVNFAEMCQTKPCHHPPQSTTIHHHPPLAKIYPPPTTTIQHHPPPAKIYLPLPTTSKKMDHHSAKAKIYSYITSFWHCLDSFFFLPNTLFLSVSEILCHKVLISSFFRFQISSTSRSSYRWCYVRT